MSPAVESGKLEAAYGSCEAITRSEAANFYWGIRLLTGERRRAMSAVYAFSRRVDDIGDGTMAEPDKLAALAEQSRALVELGERRPQSGDPVMVALADASLRFPLPLESLEALIEGVRMDVGEVRYETFEELELYCRRVAGAIGRVCLAIFGLRGGGAPDARAGQLADDLGVALQVTNILRDVREDAGNGRIYLPAEDLRRFEVLGEPEGEGRPAQLAALAGAAAAGAGSDARVQGLLDLVSFEAARARDWFARGAGLIPLLDRRSAACVLAMAGIYRRLLDRIEAHPGQALGARMSLPAREKAWVAMRAMLGGSL